MSETAIPPLSASIGSFIEKPMMASTCFTSSGCTPKPMSTSLICSSCMLFAASKATLPERMKDAIGVGIDRAGHGRLQLRHLTMIGLDHINAPNPMPGVIFQCTGCGHENAIHTL